jgi:hypothetical protein
MFFDVLVKFDITHPLQELKDIFSDGTEDNAQKHLDLIDYIMKFYSDNKLTSKVCPDYMVN